MFTFKRYAIRFILPALLMVALFALYPVVNTLVISFMHLDLHRNVPSFAGAGNYGAVLRDPRTGLAFAHTLIFTASSVFLELVFGLGLALLLRMKFPGIGATRSLVMVPWAMPAVVAALVWQWVFNDQFGLLNAVLLRTGLAHAAVPFLSTPLYAGIAVVVCEVWKTTPFMAILLLAGLQLIPPELYEGAEVDGAGAWQRFRYITLPLLKGAILIALLFRTMDALRIFDTVYVLTGGGPGNTTETISIYTYKTMFSYLDLGLGSALAMLTFGAVLAVSLAYLFFLRRTEP